MKQSTPRSKGWRGEFRPVRRIQTALAMAAALGVCVQAQAAGLDETVAGSRALGRAAGQVSANDFMATWLNPANLAAVPNNDLGFELRVPLFQGCFDRARDNSLDYQQQNPDAGITGSESFGKVCNSAPPGPTGHFGWAESFDEGWGYGIGFFTPAAIPGYKYGQPTIISSGISDNDIYAPTLNGVESPNRFLLLEREALAGYLMAGVGASPIPELRVGFSGGVGFATINNLVAASAVGGTFTDPEILSEISVADWIVPRFTASIVAAPGGDVELMASLTFQDDIRASGHLDLDANGYQGVPLRDCRVTTDRGEGPVGASGTRCRLEDIQLRVPLPTLEAFVGFRYAALRGERKRAMDPMVDEAWDIELNAYWSQTSHVDKYQLTFHDEEFAPGSPQVALSGTATAPGLPAPEGATINRQWNDTFGVRLGGDVNILPKTFSVRWGLSAESRAVPKNNMNIDIWPVGKLGLHVGATVAVDNFRLTVGYAHLFYESITVPVGQGGAKEIASQNPDKALGVNEGNFSASLDVISLGGSASF